MNPNNDVAVAVVEGPDGMPLTVGQVGLDVHAVAESTRITLDRQLHAFRDDEVRLHQSCCAALDTLVTAECTSNVGGLRKYFRGTRAQHVRLVFHCCQALRSL